MFNVETFGSESVNASYDTFSGIKAIAGHRALLTQSDPENGRFDSTSLINTLLLEEIAGPNNYIFPPASVDTEILGLLPQQSESILTIEKDSRRLSFNAKSFQDEDADGINGVYELFYGFDDADDEGINGRYGDQDEDYLTNF